MKKMETLFAQIIGSEEMKAKYEAAVSAGKTQEFLKENGCDVTLESWAEYMQSLQGEDSMSLDDMDAVAGGTGTNDIRVIDITPAVLLSSVRKYPTPNETISTNDAPPMMVTMANPFAGKNDGN